jgi:hypothetical protein
MNRLGPPKHHHEKQGLDFGPLHSPKQGSELDGRLTLDVYKEYSAKNMM